MPVTKGQIKRDKQNQKINLSNRQEKSRLRTLYKKALGDSATVEFINSVIKEVNKSTSKGILKANTASRMNSKLSNKINSLNK